MKKDKTHALDTCNVALNLSKKVNEQIDENRMPRLSISIGINSGDMLVGNLGSDTKLIHTIMGDNVNVAARLVNINCLYNSYK